MPIDLKNTRLAQQQVSDYEDEYDFDGWTDEDGQIAIPSDATPEALGLMAMSEAKQYVKDHPIVWVVDGLFTAGDIHLVAADSKIGKSTMIRTLALCVAEGREFLGRKTVQGNVLYYTLEDRMHNMVVLAETLGDADPPITLVHRLPVETPFNDAMLHLRCACHHVQPNFIIVDMLAHMVGLENVIDYVAVGKEMDRFREFVRFEYPNAALVFCHHFNKGNNQNNRARLCDPHRVMGSAAFHARVHTLVLMDYDFKTKARYIATSQRDGENLDPHELVMDPQTRFVTLGKAHGTAKAENAEDRVKRVVVALYAVLKDRNALNVSRDDLCDFMGVDRSNYNRAIGDAVKTGYLEQEGTGKRSHPYMLGKGDTVPPPSWFPEKTRTPTKGQGTALRALRARKSNQEQPK
jgi:hypothetical protein